jgi:hypothetical protein
MTPTMSMHHMSTKVLEVIALDGADKDKEKG